jgi:hypothetical protein
MAKTSLKRIRTFIEMYKMDKVIQVGRVTEGLGNYSVMHKLNDEDSNEYICKTITAAGQCVNQIIFNVPMENNISPVEQTI